MQFNGIELVFNWILTIQKWWDFDGVNVLKWSMEKNWLVVDPPLWKIWVRQLGFFFPTCSKPPPSGKEELLIINEMNPVNYNHVRIMSNSYHTKQIQTKNAPQETAQSHWNDQLSNAVPTTKSLSCSMATSLGHRDSAARVDSSAWSLRNMASICSHCNCCQWSKWLLASM